MISKNLIEPQRRRGHKGKPLYSAGRVSISEAHCTVSFIACGAITIAPYICYHKFEMFKKLRASAVKNYL